MARSEASPETKGSIVSIRKRYHDRSFATRIQAFKTLPNERPDGSSIGLKTKLKLVFAKDGTVGVNSKLLPINK